MSLIYSLIAREPNIVLVEYTEYKGNFMQIIRTILEKGIPDHDKTIIPCEKYKIHILKDNSLIYICLSEDMADDCVFSFLFDLQKKLLKKEELEEIKNKSAYGLGSFEDNLRQMMIYYNSQPYTNKTGEIINELNLAKDAAIENVEKMFEREDKINIIAMKSDNLEDFSFNVNFLSDTMKKNEQKKNRNIIFIVIAIIAILVILYFLF